MVINRIFLHNFKNFTDKHKFTLEKINLVSGANGKGKSTLAVDSILFCLFGYYRLPLSELISKGLKQTTVSLELEHQNSNYTITRTYPTSITIIQDGVELKLANNNEKQKELNKLFKDIDYFRKFRMIDITAGINFLEEGKISLQKTLVSFNENSLNDIREQLLKEKQKRETWNKDNINVSPLFPSETRKQILTTGHISIVKEEVELSILIDQISSQLGSLISEQGKIQGERAILQQQANNLKRFNVCPTCTQTIGESLKEEAQNKADIIIQKTQDRLDIVSQNIKKIQDHIQDIKTNLPMLSKHKEKIQTLLYKLNTRISQKNYQYTTKDVELYKKAIQELDKFYGFYTNETVKTLEPIINNILSKIGFTLYFVLDAKGNLDIKLNKGTQEYCYKNLSNGQKLILSIAFQLALLLNNNEDGIIIADEGFGSLDSNNLNLVFELFNDLPFQLISIVHRMDNIPDGINLIELT